MLQDKKLIFIGYLIEGKVLYNYRTKKLICLNGSGGEVLLRKTMSRVLEYLISHATKDFVTDLELMHSVWDQHGLSSSTQRVWQVMSNFKSRLLILGIDDDFIMRISKKGYLLKKDSVEVLFRSRHDSMAGYEGQEEFINKPE